MPLCPGFATPTQGLNRGDQHTLTPMDAGGPSASVLMRLWISCDFATMGYLLQQLRHRHLERLSQFGHRTQGWVLLPYLQPGEVLPGNPRLLGQGGLGEALFAAEGVEPSDKGFLGILHCDL